MKLWERIDRLMELFLDLQSTNSPIVKREYINELPEELKDDFQYIVEILAGKHKLGYKFTWSEYDGVFYMDYMDDYSIRQYMKPLFGPIENNDLSSTSIYRAERQCSYYYEFIGPIVNRELRLGIGASIIPKDGMEPMLAQKYDGRIRQLAKTLYITEKLDGNRCIARFDGSKWIFTSRNGKIKFNYDFDMSFLPTDNVYDGEVLSLEQYGDSQMLINYLHRGGPKPIYKSLFNISSGIMNRKDVQHGLIYNIFDIMSDEAYEERRKYIDSLVSNNKSETVRIVPVLAKIDNDSSSKRYIDKLCEDVSSCGAEGIMINLSDAPYIHKRNYNLLKYKKHKTMDMRVIELVPGTGKYEGEVGSLYCEASFEDTDVSCNVGTGLSDNQRYLWSRNPSLIVGQIIEVEYFEVTQNASSAGTKKYSLRFPRFKNIRHDKSDTSIF